ncbi:MAG: DUF4294 domain-containing protein [Candidatus Cryptobacteroides sp.]
MEKCLRILMILAVSALASAAQYACAQNRKAYSPFDHLMQYGVENGDTVFYDTIKPSRIYARLPKQKGTEWRRYYKLVHNFSKAYPYALAARKMVHDTDSIIETEHLSGIKRDRYINQLQKELFEVFEGQMRNLTVTQGMLIMKLIDRETGKTSYSIIKEYKSGITAGFWQGVAKMFGSDMKKPYDPEGDDLQVEELVRIWEAGDFPALYYSLFWKEPPVVQIPEKYLNWKPSPSQDD